MQGTGSSEPSGTSLVMRRPLGGCQCWGTTVVVAFKTHRKRNQKYLNEYKCVMHMHKLCQKLNGYQGMNAIIWYNKATGRCFCTVRLSIQSP